MSDQVTIEIGGRQIGMSGQMYRAFFGGADLAGVIADRSPFAGIDVQIEHAGSQIILPESPTPMSLGTAIETLTRKKAEEEQTISVAEQIDAFPKDGAVAFQKAMQQMFGWASAVPTPGFFGSRPPQTLDVEVGVNERISVVWGRFELPGIEGYLECAVSRTEAGPRFRLQGEIKRKDFATIRQLAETTREIVARESIYRVKAISLSVDDKGDVDWDDGISFVDVSGVDADDLVLTEANRRQIEASLWTPIERSEVCRRHGIPLKRGILLEGRYGTGKTMTSNITAQKALANGWTFLTIDRVAGLDDALDFAAKYQPCVIFAEDIDRIVSGSERTIDIDDVLNTVDGIGSKGTEIMVVLTTNHIETINRAMLRPGRLDAVISVEPPDAEAARRLLRRYGRTVISQDDPLQAAGEALAGQIPAVIRECVERAKLYAISRAQGEPRGITDEDIAAAATDMQPHIALLQQSVEEKRDPSLRDLIDAAIGDRLETLLLKTDLVAKLAGGAQSFAYESASATKTLTRAMNDQKLSQHVEAIRGEVSETAHRVRRMEKASADRAEKAA